jgi:hypothetical protein
LKQPPRRLAALPETQISSLERFFSSPYQINHDNDDRKSLAVGSDTSDDERQNGRASKRLSLLMTPMRLGRWRIWKT